MKTKAEQNETRKGKTKMKTKEELNAIKNEIDTLNKKLAELNEEELAQVTGGHGISISNPLAGMSEEEAKRIAQQLDEGTCFGPWNGMSGEQFLAWWRASNGQ